MLQDMNPLINDEVAYRQTAIDMVKYGVMGAIHDEFNQVSAERNGKTYVAFDASTIKVLNREVNPKSAEISANQKPNLFAKANRPVEMVARKGNVTHGIAMFDPIMNEWAVFTNHTDDVRTGNYTTQYTTTVAQAVNLLKAVPGVQISTSKNFNGRNPNSFGSMVLTPTATDGAFKAYVKRKARNAVLLAQNQYLPIKERVNFLMDKGIINDSSNVWQRLVLYHGRTGARLENFDNAHVKPITDLSKEVVKKGGTVQEIDDYLYALAAPERNAVLRQRNSKKDSGISDAEAAKIVADAQSKPYFRSEEHTSELQSH